MELPALIALLTAAEGGSREIDADLFWALNERDSGICYANGATGLPKPLDHTQPMPGGMGRFAVRAMAPRYTASVDEALVLVGEKQPETGWLCGSNGLGEFMAELFRTKFISGVETRIAYATAPTAPLALLCALLTALAAEDQQ